MEQKSQHTNLKVGVVLLGAVFLIMWSLEIVDLLFLGGALDSFGIRPRSLDGLDGILLAPFLHGGLAHLANNSIPFLLFGALTFMGGLRAFLVATLLSLLSSGLGVWFLGAEGSIHVGISGLIFGYLGYLLLRGYFDRSVGAILVSLLLLFLYGGTLWGLLPFQVGVSWTGHLFGFLGGAFAAYLLRRRRPSYGMDPRAVP